MFSNLEYVDTMMIFFFDDDDDDDYDERLIV